MVIYKETLFAIILAIGFLVAIGLIMTRERRARGNTASLEESAKQAGTADSVEDYLKEHYSGA